MTATFFIGKQAIVGKEPNSSFASEQSLLIAWDLVYVKPPVT